MTDLLSESINLGTDEENESDDNVGDAISPLNDSSEVISNRLNECIILDNDTCESDSDDQHDKSIEEADVQIDSDYHHHTTEAAPTPKAKKQKKEMTETPTTQPAAASVQEKSSPDAKVDKKRRMYHYVAIEKDETMEQAIEKLTRISDLGLELINYMVLRDINYFLDIYAGECEHSWRHLEYKKNSKRSGNFLYENTALTCYSFAQYSQVVEALQSVFCKKNNRLDEYIVKVLMPEALVKMCMRIYQCSKASAEEYLAKYNLKTCVNRWPRGSMTAPASCMWSPSSSPDRNLDDSR